MNVAMLKKWTPVVCVVVGVAVGCVLTIEVERVSHLSDGHRVQEIYYLARIALELLYFVSGIAVAVAVILGLKQLEITRQIAKTNADRESVKYAAERCQYFAEHTVPSMTTFSDEYQRLRLTFLTVLNPPAQQWAVKNGEIISPNADVRVIDAEIPKLGNTLVNCINSMEAFAIPFAAGVADEGIGFKETALVFCQWVKGFLPAYSYMRRTNNGRFESTLKLYDLWNTRLIAAALAPVMKTFEEIIKAAARDRIRPHGDDRY